MAKEYARQWDIPSDSEEGKTYKVSLTMDGELQCSCPRWVFKRELCKHIEDAVSGVYDIPLDQRPPFVLRFYNGNKVELTDDLITINVPLRVIGDVDAFATNVYDLLALGVSWIRIKELFHIPDEIRPLNVFAHIQAHGRKER